MSSLPPPLAADPAADRRRRVRRTAILCGSIAVAFYLAFIVMSVLRATS